MIEKTGKKCPVCGDDLRVFEMEFAGKARRLPIACQCKRDQEKKRKKEIALQKVHAASWNTGEYRHMTLMNFEDRRPGTRQQLQTFLKNSAGPEGAWLWIHGRPGAGKTHAAVAVLKNLCVLGDKSAQVFRWAKYCNDLRASWNDSESNFDANAIYTRQLVLIDDIDKQISTTWAADLVFAIVDHRYAEKKQTIFTSNKSPEQIRDLIARRGQQDMAESIYRRILQLATILAF